MNQVFAIFLYIFPVRLGHRESPEIVVYTADDACICYYHCYLFFSHQALSALPLCTSLFQICVQFPFLSTGPRTISFKDIIEWGLKSQSNFRSASQLEPYSDNSCEVRNGSWVSMSCSLPSKPPLRCRDRERERGGPHMGMSVNAAPF